jgi:hypothetical protein
MPMHIRECHVMVLCNMAGRSGAAEGASAGAASEVP